MTTLDHAPPTIADVVLANASAARLALGDALPHQQETCLSCGEAFDSYGSENRVCPACKAKQEAP